ncbi:MAG: hypothetical protein ACK5RO_11905 [Pseudobdellovibrionaceae bacterium]
MNYGLIFLFWILPFFASAQTGSCTGLNQRCSSGDRSPFVQQFRTAAEVCRIEKASLGCDYIAGNDAEVAANIQKCDAENLCLESEQTAKQILEGCWSGTQKVFEEYKDIVVGAIKGVPKSYDSAKQCLGRPECRAPVFNAAMRAALRTNPLTGPYLLAQDLRPHLTRENFNLGIDKAAELHQKAVTYLVDQGFKFQCFNKQARADMICYGVVAVVAPGAAGKVLTKVPRLAKLLTASRAEQRVNRAEAAVSDVRRNPEVALERRTPDIPRTPERTVFIERYGTRDFTSPNQNGIWMEAASVTRADGKTFFLDVENSALKKLNDVTKDKALVTALTNRHKELLMGRMTTLEKQFPNVEFLPYSDFKSVRFAFRPRPPATEIPPQFQRELQSAFQETNTRFAQSLREAQLLRPNDEPLEWFRAGVGQTADQANSAARYSRNISGSNRVQNFSDPSLQTDLRTSLDAAEMWRSDLQKSLGSTGLLETTNAGKMLPRPEVFDMVRKTETPEQLQAVILARTGTQIPLPEARRLRDYTGLVDEFSAGIHTRQRVLATLEDNAAGGINLDFAGMGSQNLRGTAEALTRSNTVQNAVEQSRLAERSVTEVFNQRKVIAESTVNRVLSRYGISAEIRASGDDMVVRPSRPIPPRAREEIAQEMARNMNGAPVRMSHVPPGVRAPQDRNLIGVHGESVEKILRQKLEGVIPPEKLNSTVFMVDMQATEQGVGSAQLLIGQGRNTLNDIERQRVQRVFRDAVQSLNESLKKDNKPAAYRPAG